MKPTIFFSSNHWYSKNTCCNPRGNNPLNCKLYVPRSCHLFFIYFNKWNGYTGTGSISIPIKSAKTNSPKTVYIKKSIIVIERNFPNAIYELYGL